MKLTLVVTAVAAYLKFTTPSAGTYYVYSGIDVALIEASNHVTNVCHVVVRLPVESPHKVYHVQFFPNNYDNRTNP